MYNTEPDPLRQTEILIDHDSFPTFDSHLIFAGSDFNGSFELFCALPGIEGSEVVINT